ncbi:MAG: hypothetical protein EP326_00490 [Deltaproteobacteria bacterium]|nr:MAG: hypothetical protein EP326_00490 [Deltaproteobacteria bacterium]TNF25322.1 MAG: hypothetical protein EP319_16495 [Deltaproteobacteria bacterium]
MLRLSLILFSLLSIKTAHAMSCLGTEPFWGAEITSEKLKLDLFIPGDASHLSWDVAKVEGAVGYVDGFVQVFSDSEGPIAVTRKTACNDGMSDYDYEREVIIFSPNGVLFGCCDRIE